jgi:hypothetical protein
LRSVGSRALSDFSGRSAQERFNPAMSKNKMFWSAVVVAGVAVAASQVPATAQNRPQPERQLLGIRLGRPVQDVMQRFKGPSEVQTVALFAGGDQLPGVGGAAGAGGGGMPGAMGGMMPGMGGGMMGGMMPGLAGGGAGAFGGGGAGPYGGGGGVGGAAGGYGAMMGRMAPGGAAGGAPAMGGMMPGAGSAMMGRMAPGGGGAGPYGGGNPFGGGGGGPYAGAGGGGGPYGGVGGGIPSLPPAAGGAGGGGFPGLMGPNMGGGDAGFPGGAGGGVNMPEYSNAILWIYKRPQNVRLEFLINEDGRVAQISAAAPAGTPYTGARTAKGVTLGSSLNRVMAAYGYPERHRMLPGNRFYEAYYTRNHHAAFTFDTEKNFQCVRITIALAD